MKAHFKLPLLIIFALLSTNCSERSLRSSSETQLAERQISDGNYNAAIAMMSERLSAYPEDSRARVILASAYAGRAGIFMRQYNDILNQIIDKIRFAESVMSTGSFSLFTRLEQSTRDEQQRNLISTFDRIYKAIFYVNQIIQIFDLLPQMTDQSRKDMRTAIALLDQESNLTGGPVLYRGLLRLVALKNDLRDQYDFSVLNNCRIDVSKLSQQLASLKGDIMGVLHDFVNGSVNGKSSALLKETQKIEDSFDQAIVLLATLPHMTDVENSAIVKQINGGCHK